MKAEINLAALITDNDFVKVGDSAEIEIRSAATGTLATLYEDRDGTTPLSNPFNADADGNFTAFVDAGTYQIEATSGAVTKTISYYTAFVDGFGAVFLDDDNTWTGVNTFQGDVEVTNINAETTSGGVIKASGGATVLSWGSGGFGNITLGVDMSGAGVARLTNMADPTSAQDYATKAYVDGSGVFAEYAEIDFGALSAGTTHTAAHGLSSEPKFLLLIAECTTAEHGYSIGDKIIINPSENSAASSIYLTPSFDATNVKVRQDGVAALATIADEDSGGTSNMSLGSWDIKVRVCA